MHTYDNETVVYFNCLFQNDYYFIIFVGSITDNTRSFFKISYKNNEREKNE